MSDTNYNLRQLKLMEDKISLYEQSKIGFFHLVVELKAIFNVLTFTDEKWSDHLQAEINMLELVQQSIDDGSINRWRENPSDTIENSLKSLKMLIFQKFEIFLNTFDVSIIEKAMDIDSNLIMCPNCQEVWQIFITSPMVVCPTCLSLLHNPKYLPERK